MNSIKLDVFITLETFTPSVYRKISDINPRFRAEYIRSTCTFAIKMENWFNLFELAKGASKPTLAENTRLEASVPHGIAESEDIRVSVIVEKHCSPELFNRLIETPKKRGTLRHLIHSGYAMGEIIAQVEQANRYSQGSTRPDREAGQKESVAKEPATKDSTASHTTAQENLAKEGLTEHQETVEQANKGVLEDGETDSKKDQSAMNDYVKEGDKEGESRNLKPTESPVITQENEQKKPVAKRKFTNVKM